MFIYQASRNVSSCHVKTKVEAVWLLNRHVRLIKPQCVRRVKKIVCDGGNELLKRTNDLEVDGAEACSTPSGILKKHERVERV